MDARLRGRIAKLIPLLGPEPAHAAAAIDRVLAAAGFDWHDLAAVVEAAAEPVRADPPFDPGPPPAPPWNPATGRRNGPGVDPAPPVPPQPREPGQPRSQLGFDLRDVAEAMAAWRGGAKDITEWQTEFLFSLDEQVRERKMKLSEKQRIKLDELFDVMGLS